MNEWINESGSSSSYQKNLKYHTYVCKGQKGVSNYLPD